MFISTAPRFGAATVYPQKAVAVSSQKNLTESQSKILEIMGAWWDEQLKSTPYKNMLGVHTVELHFFKLPEVTEHFSKEDIHAVGALLGKLKHDEFYNLHRMTGDELVEMLTEKASRKLS